MGVIKKYNFSHNLAGGAIAQTISFGAPFKLRSVAFKFSASLTDTITLKIDNAEGSNYDTTISTLAYTTASDGYNSYGDNYIFLEGDALAITSTSSTAAIVYGTIIVELL